MANHVRQQIRDAAATTLTGLATTTTNVFKSRLNAVPDNKLPALLVDTLEEEGEPSSMAGASRLIHRTLTLQVRAMVKAVSGYQDTLDTICKEVETALGNNNGLTGTCKWVNPVAQKTELEGDGEKPVAVCTLLFSVLYVTALNAPDAPL